MTDILRRGANDIWHLELTDLQISQFARYAELLVEWNATRMNLTRLLSPRDIAVKHFLDSLAIFKATTLPQNAKLLDIGTGAGMPGLALKIVRPDLNVTLLDSTAKKLLFCRAVADDLGFIDVVTLHARAEEAAALPAHARAYDIATARAVAPLEKLLPWCAPFLRRDGLLIALKGGGVEEELVQASFTAKRLGLRFETPVIIDLPEAEEEMARRVVIGKMLK